MSPRSGVMDSVMAIGDLPQFNSSLCACLRFQRRAKVLMRGNWINSLCIKERNWISHTQTHSRFGSLTKFSLCRDTSVLVLILNQYLKGTGHPKIEVLSPFTHLNVISNLFDFLSQNTKYILKSVGL